MIPINFNWSYLTSCPISQIYLSKAIVLIFGSVRRTIIVAPQELDLQPANGIG